MGDGARVNIISKSSVQTYLCVSRLLHAHTYSKENDATDQHPCTVGIGLYGAGAKVSIIPTSSGRHTSVFVSPYTHVQ